ncbi:MAG: class I SAM-dependent methyltransferase [Parvibaculum sedimenti]|uniref:class I SAM-dependent methyltransferase n=1 Tax=Parvibaculum sedimenti TaxID=2608632 RepID=UPI003BB6BC9F
MLVALADIEIMLRKPGAPWLHVALRRKDGVVSEVTAGDEQFPVVHGQPVLIDFADSVVRPEWFATAQDTYSLVGARRGFLRGLKGRLFGTADISTSNFFLLREHLKALPVKRPLVLMVGAATKGMGTDLLYNDEAIAQVAFDVYPSPLTNFVADGHKIPLADESVDAVCIQAVLEHVLDPRQVAMEVARVLKPGGLVYAETPFMQQVHEGAYDFTRFSEVGHRWLWRDFETVKRGALGGPGLSLYWAVKYFLRGLTRSKAFADIASIPFGIFSLFDRFVPEPHRVDGASGTYFMGRKSGRSLTVGEIVGEYRGAQR